MQNTIFRWFLYTFLLLLPLGLDANVDSKTATNSALANADASKTYRHFPKAHLLDRFRIYQKSSTILENRKNTEGSSDTKDSAKKVRNKRFWTIFGSIVGGLALIYWLQGTIWLAVVTLAIVLYFANRKKINAWEHERYVRMQKSDDAPLDTDSKGQPIYPLSHSANKWTRRAINRFAIGAVLGGIGLLVVLLGAITGGVSSIAGLVGVGVAALLLGYGFSIVAFFNAFQAIANKEPKQALAWLIVLLSLPSVITLLGGLLAF